MSCCSSITDVLKKVLSAIAPIVAIALVCFAVYALFIAGPGVLGALQGLSWMPAGLAAMEATTLGYIALGAALIISPETVTEIATSIATTVGKVAGTIATAALGGLAGGLFDVSSPWGLALLAGAFYYFVLRDKKTDKPAELNVTTSKPMTPELARPSPISEST